MEKLIIPCVMNTASLFGISALSANWQAQSNSVQNAKMHAQRAQEAAIACLQDLAFVEY